MVILFLVQILVSDLYMTHKKNIKKWLHVLQNTFLQYVQWWDRNILKRKLELFHVHVYTKACTYISVGSRRNNTVSQELFEEGVWSSQSQGRNLHFRWGTFIVLLQSSVNSILMDYLKVLCIIHTCVQYAPQSWV